MRLRLEISMCTTIPHAHLHIIIYHKIPCIAAVVQHLPSPIMGSVTLVPFLLASDAVRGLLGGDQHNVATSRYLKIVGREDTWHVKAAHSPKVSIWIGLESFFVAPPTKGRVAET